MMADQQTSMFSVSRAPHRTTYEPTRSPGADARDAAYRAIFHSLGKKQRQYYLLMQRVTRHGQKTSAGIVHDLTDMEAARILGWERTSVNARRNELMDREGVRQDIRDNPLITESRLRQCLVTKRDGVTAWRAIYPADLFTPDR